MSSTLAKTDFSTHPETFPGAARPPQHGHAAGPGAPRGTRVREWLGRLLRWRAPPLVLEMTHRSVRFRGIDEFEFALRSRTEFPASRLRALMGHTPAQLEAAATSIRDAERMLSGILARTRNEPALLGELLREVELGLFSQDHGWRDIMDGLMRLSPAHDPYKRVALVKYLQYLRARQVVMRSAFVEKTHGDEGAGLHATRALPGAAADGHGDTALFHSPHGEWSAPAGERGYRTLPKAETVEVRLGDVRHMDLLLAGNHMRLYTGRDCYLVDDGNNTYPLHAGKNLVGRHGGCDVVVDPACRSVSRIHLIVECLAGNRVRLTDLSSHGTEIAAGVHGGG